jgi:hypothetical protein
VTPAEKLQNRLAALGITQRGFARLAGVQDRAVRYWVAGDREIPDFVWPLLDTIPAPPPAGSTDDADRDAACSVALAKPIDELIARAVEQGWSEAEILTALIEAAARRAALLGSPTAAADLLRQTIRALRE